MMCRGRSASRAIPQSGSGSGLGRDARRWCGWGLGECPGGTCGMRRHRRLPSGLFKWHAPADPNGSPRVLVKSR